MKNTGVLNLNKLVIEDIAESLKGYFRDKEEILLAFIFGSAVSGRLTKDSDVDIAVLFRNIPGFSDILKVIGAVSDVIGREVDIVDLNNSSPIIRMQVLKNGKLIKKKDDTVYINFYVKAVKEYDDLRHIRKEAEEKILRGRMYA